MAIYLLGPFRLDAEAAILFRGAELVALGHRAVALLRVLVERQREPAEAGNLPPEGRKRLDRAWD